MFPRMYLILFPSVIRTPHPPAPAPVRQSNQQRRPLFTFLLFASIRVWSGEAVSLCLGLSKLKGDPPFGEGKGLCALNVLLFLLLLLPSFLQMSSSPLSWNGDEDGITKGKIFNYARKLERAKPKRRRRRPLLHNAPREILLWIHASCEGGRENSPKAWFGCVCVQSWGKVLVRGCEKFLPALA